MTKPISERSSISWNTLISRKASRPATATISVDESQPAIHAAAKGFDGVRSIRGQPVLRSDKCREARAGIGDAAAICNGQIWRGGHRAGATCAEADFDLGAAARLMLRSG